jgi:BMFP domain-containing protein YqiC
LVTREEFDIQTKVLQATRAKVEALEKQLPLMHNKS